MANQDNIHYHSEPRVDQHFHVLMNTYDYEDAIFHIYNKLKDYRELKEMYVRFNSRNAGTPTAAREELIELITFYATLNILCSVTLSISGTDFFMQLEQPHS